MHAQPEVVVVGAGIVGLSIAFHLGRRGLSVTVLERVGIGAGASGIQPGGVRQQWGTSVNALLVGQSLDFYESAQEALGMRVDPGFRRCGYLFLAHSESTLERLRANVALQNKLGVRSRIVDPAGASELVPGLDVSTVAGGSWCADDGYFDRPQSLVEALGALADVQHGDVIDVGEDGTVRLAAGKELRPQATVVAAGVDTPRLLPELPIRPDRRALLFSDPVAERLLEPLVVSPERHFAAKQLGDGRLLASDLAASGDSPTQVDEQRANVRQAFEELLPRLVYVALPKHVVGVYDVTPDSQAILGRVRERVWVAAGFSGHGFMMAPAVGRIIAESMTGDREDEILRILDAARFDEGRLIPEPQVV